MEYIIITGASKGLGNSLAKTIIGKDKILLLIARDKDKLLELKNFLWYNYEQKSFVYPFDLNNYENINFLVDDMISQIDVNNDWKITFINNAGIIYPIKCVDGLEKSEIKNSITVNVLSPIFIISKLIEFTSINNKLLKIINISSGAYKQPIGGWSLYCTSKAAMQIFFEVIELEHKNNSLIKSVSIDPGVMDTEMQESIRNAPSNGFKNKDVFMTLYKENKLCSTTQVAKIINENFINRWDACSAYIKLDKFFESK